MRFQRRAITVALLAAAVFAPTRGQAQSSRAAQRVPSFLVVPFRSPGEPKLGIETAEAIRRRMLRFFPMPPLRTLRTLSREEINRILDASGFPPDSVVSSTDIADLTRQMGAEETMEGSIRRTDRGVEARARFYFNANTAAPEVLPLVVETSAENAGKRIAELYVQARKELPAYERCKNALIQNNGDQAVVAAHEAAQQYPQGVMWRACLLTAYGPQFKAFPADSIIRLGTEIVAIDSTNEIALGQLVDAYAARGDSLKAIEASQTLFRLNPSNIPTARSIIDLLSRFGAPEKGKRIVDELVNNNPGDPDLLQKKWTLLLKMKDWKGAISTGEEMVKFDSTRADTGFFWTQIAASVHDSQPRLTLHYLERATTKFPRDVSLLRGYAQELRRQGQLQQALDVSKRTIAIDPHDSPGYASILLLYIQMGQPDSAVGFAKTALVAADSATRELIGAGLLKLIAPAIDTAQADTASPPDVQRANWTRVYKLSAAVDSVVPQAQTAFFMSFAAFNLSMNALNRVQPLAAARNTPAACSELANAGAMVLIVDLNMSRGGRANPAAASNILRAVSGTIKPYLETTRAQLHCR